MDENDNSDVDVAIVGLAARVPGADTAAALWRNLVNGVESIRDLTVDELRAAGVSAADYEQPGYVARAAVLDGFDRFDAEFFGFSRKDGAIMDPQHRQFLSVCWEALEDAGRNPADFDGAIGVFGGCGANNYYYENVLSNDALVRDVGHFLLRHTGNDKDFLSTRVSYLLDLRGPSIGVQTACSTSLVAVHLAVQQLASGACDMALAGGVTIELPHGRGYQYREGEILSHDGRCRPFDARATGTVFGSGTGAVVLRRLGDAVADGDHIYAIIRGSAVNNDGTGKVGYLAPSVDGQAACISEALAVSGVPSSSISYVEAHGTGTAMGDPIEVAALTQAFQAADPAARTTPCLLGSVKSNVGHLDTAAGVVGLIKVALALHHGQVPPTLHFRDPNPAIDFEHSPFRVSNQVSAWPRVDGSPRRAAINSLGVGGTNAFVVLQEAPTRPAPTHDRPLRPLLLSADSPAALDDAQQRLADWIEADPRIDMVDVAHTLMVGRRARRHRRVVVAGDRDHAVRTLCEPPTGRSHTHAHTDDATNAVFLFPGGGAQYPRMAAGLHDTEPVFRHHLDAGIELLRDRHSIDLRPVLFAEAGDVAAAATAFERPSLQLPAIFLVEHALAQTLIAKGVTPAAMLGHSVGENTAACVGGTMTFDDCLGLVVLRGQLMDTAAGAMVSINAAAGDVAELLSTHDLDLAAVNGPELCVASGPDDRFHALEAALEQREIPFQRVRIHIAAHSRLLDDALPVFRAYLTGIALAAPTTPWVSNLTGTWVTDEQATDPEYWVRQLRNTVQFSAGIATLAADPAAVFVEVGPGTTLSTFARMSDPTRPGHPCLPAMRRSGDDVDDQVALLELLGRLWAVGHPIAPEALFGDERGRRVPLPTYPFQTTKLFIEPAARTHKAEDDVDVPLDREPDEARWFWEHQWAGVDALEPEDEPTPLTWLVFADGLGVGDALADDLRRAGHEVVMVRLGDSFHAGADGHYVLAAEHGRDGYEQLVRDLVRTGRVPDRVAHLWLLVTDDQFRPGSSMLHRNQECGFYSLLFLLQVWGSEGLERPLHLVVTTSGVQRVIASDRVRWPEQATVSGPALVLPHELGDVTVSCVDIDPDDLDDSTSWRERISSRLSDAPQRSSSRARVITAIGKELRAPCGNSEIAIRGDRRYERVLRRLSSRTAPSAPRRELRRGGTVLVTGGLGGIGPELARELFEQADAKLVLLTRRELPSREHWDSWLAAGGDTATVGRSIRTVQQLERSGAQVMVVQGDVTDIHRMREVVEEASATFGAITGVVHAAGTMSQGIAATKSQADVEEVLGPKMYGTLVLAQVLPLDELDFFLLCSSTSTSIAPPGQVDYVAANAFLNAFAESAAASGRTNTVAVNWGVWSEVGMATVAAADLTGTPAPPAPRPCSHPWLESAITDGAGVHTFRAEWSVAEQWVLAEHRMRDGMAVLPGVAYLELARAALAEIGHTQPFEMADLLLLEPLPVPDSGRRTVRVQLSSIEVGYRFSVDVFDDDGAARTCDGDLVLSPVAAPPPIDITAVVVDCPREGLITGQHRHLDFGPRWAALTRVQRGDSTAVASLSLPADFRADVTTFGMHPALLDCAVLAAVGLIDGYDGEHLWVPLGIESATIFTGLPAVASAIVRVRPGGSESTGFASIDCVVVGQDGTVAVRIDGLTMRRVSHQLGEVGPASTRRRGPVTSAQPGGASPQRSLAPSERVFLHNLRHGIRPTEGRRALREVLRGRGGSVVTVSSIDVRALVQQADRLAEIAAQSTESDPAQRFERPALASEFVAPRDEIERTLAAMWQALLGVQEVGVSDSFFDLGGHSLVAVRLFAAVKKTFSVEFPISVLFEAPTVAAIAELIRGAAPAGTTGDHDATITPTRRRFQYLVPMHPDVSDHGPLSDRAPFFLVAGMFGNVLNLRHLAHQIGRDRAFYGIQAKGLYGEDSPHLTFEEMAADYLAEVRAVQPEGPYFLGGFSGGGLAAYEMVRQLQAAGEEVALLVLLDTPLAHRRPLSRRDRFAIHWSNLRHDGLRYATSWARQRIEWEQRHRRLEAPPVRPDADGALHSTVIESAFLGAVTAYRTTRIEGDITLFRPRLSPWKNFGPGRLIGIGREYLLHDNGWSEFCDHVTIIEVPGDHSSMVLEPNVRVLAGHLRAAIDRATSSPAAADDLHRPAAQLVAGSS